MWNLVWCWRKSEQLVEETEKCALVRLNPGWYCVCGDLARCLVLLLPLITWVFTPEQAHCPISSSS